MEQTHADWEELLERMFGLSRVIIADDYGDPAISFWKVANAAAQYLDETIQSGDVIGVSWGRTLGATIREMRSVRKCNCSVVQLLGTQSMDGFPVKSDDMVRALANKLDCPTCMLYAPAIVSKPETKIMLLQERIIQHAFERMNACNIGIFGIGELTEDAPMYKMGFISKSELEALRADGFCADIGMNPVRPDGSYDRCFLETRLLNANVDCIRQMKKTVAIASGREKATAVAAVARSGCVNTLILDSTLAEQVILNEKCWEDKR